VKLLRANLALNGLDDRATVLPVAASDSAGLQPFERGTRTEGAYRWTKGRIADRSSADAVLVETVTLDGLVADGLVDPQAVGLLWLDCQKHEERVLQTASVFVERRVPIVFALRPRELGPSSPLVRQLTRAYEHVVHLRRRARSDGAWTPQIEPIAQLAELCGRKSSTDLLVATGLGDREPNTSGTASTSAAST
jgi:FkbM family methyltransferase